MTGIFLIAVVGLWLWACVAVARALMRKRHEQPWRLVLGPVVFIVMLAAPVADEIVGGFQFRALCEKNAVLRLGVEKPEGRVTRFSADPANEISPGTAIVIYHSRERYTDVKSGELVLEFDKYVAKGGLFIRALGISEDNAPITIGRPWCSPEKARGEAINRTLKFSVLN